MPPGSRRRRRTRLRTGRRRPGPVRSTAKAWVIETMPRVGGDRRGIADLVDRQEHERGIVVHEVVEPPRSQAVAGDDPVAMVRLAATRHDAGLDQIDNAVGDDVAVDAEVAAVLEMAQRLVRHAPEPDLQRRAVVDDRRRCSAPPSRRSRRLADGGTPSPACRRSPAHRNGRRGRSSRRGCAASPG